MFEIISGILIVNAIPAYFVAKDADERNMNSVGWFTIALIYSFIGMLLYIIVRNPRKNDLVINSEFKMCPECAESIKIGAKICRYCGFRNNIGLISLPEETNVEKIKFPLQVKIIEDNAPVYSEADNKSKIIKRMKKDECILAISQNGDFDEWLEIEIQNGSGYLLKYETDL